MLFDRADRFFIHLFILKEFLCFQEYIMICSFCIINLGELLKRVDATSKLHKMFKKSIKQNIFIVNKQNLIFIKTAMIKGK